MHGRNWMELTYLVREGLTPLAAWYGATGLAAREIGQDDTGVVEPGKRADLLIASGDVIESPELFENGALVEVIKDGVGYRTGIPEVPQRTYADVARNGANG